jgi:hypothetical protein
MSASDRDELASLSDHLAPLVEQLKRSNRALNPDGKISSRSCQSGPTNHVRTAPSTIAPTRIPPLRARRPMARPEGSGFRGCNSKIRRGPLSSGDTTAAYAGHRCCGAHRLGQS